MGHVITGDKSFVHLGAQATPMRVMNPSGNWTAWLPPFEDQSQHGLETFACVSYSLNNVLDTQASFQGHWQVSSDRFLAKVSGTVEGQGNSYANVFSAIAEDGVPPRTEWDWPSDNPCPWSSYYADIPAQVIVDATKYLGEWDLNVPQYMDLDVDTMRSNLQYSPIWFCTDSHSMMIYRMDDQYFYIYDSEAADTNGLTKLPFSWLPNIVAAANVQITPKTMPTFDPQAFIAANDLKIIFSHVDETVGFVEQGKFKIPSTTERKVQLLFDLQMRGVSGPANTVNVTDPSQWQSLMGVAVQF